MGYSLGSVKFLWISAADEKIFMFEKSRTLLESPCIVRIAPPNSTIGTDGTPTRLDSNVLSASNVAKCLPPLQTQISRHSATRYEPLA